MSSSQRATLLLFVVAAAACQPPSGATPLRSALAVTRLEVNQAIGVQYLNAAKFVAGKDTVVIAYLDAPTTVNPATQQLTVIKDGQEAGTLPPLAVEGQVTALVFACATREQCGNWAEGSYTFNASIDGASMSTSATFVVRRPLRILAVPVTVNYGSLGGVLSPDDKWKTGGEFMRRSYPVAAAGFQWTMREQLDLSSIDISSETGQRAVWQALANLNPPPCTSNPSQAGCYDKIIGFVKSRIGMLQGYTFGDPANIVVNDDEDMMGTVAHESGHPFQLGDEYEGGSFNCAVNPTPPAYVGNEWTSRMPGHSCAGSPELPSTVGGTAVAIMASAAHPFEVGGRGGLGDTANFMGSGALQANQWISPRAYDQLFNVMVPFVTPMAVGTVVEIEGSWVREAGGTITVTLEPWFSYTGTQPADTQPATATSLYARALDASDKVLATQNLDDGMLPIQDPPVATSVDDDVLHGAIAFPPGTVKFQILQGTTVLKELPVSASPPVVTLTSPAGGSTLAGSSAIAWTVTDSDASAVFHANVEYSADNGTTWMELATGVEGQSGLLMENFDDLAGSNGQSLVRVTVTDGINTGSATSAPFSVAVKAPEVELESPHDGETIAYGQTLWLSAEVYDEQDGDLESAAAVKWSSNRDGQLGGGTLVGAAKLSPGAHTLQVTATNSAGVSTSKTVTITVGMDLGGGGCAITRGPQAPAWPLGVVAMAFIALAWRRRRASAA